MPVAATDLQRDWLTRRQHVQPECSTSSWSSEKIHLLTRFPLTGLELNQLFLRRANLSLHISAFMKTSRLNWTVMGPVRRFILSWKTPRRDEMSKPFLIWWDYPSPVFISGFEYQHKHVTLDSVPSHFLPEPCLLSPKYNMDRTKATTGYFSSRRLQIMRSESIFVRLGLSCNMFFPPKSWKKTDRSPPPPPTSHKTAISALANLTTRQTFVASLKLKLALREKRRWGLCPVSSHPRTEWSLSVEKPYIRTNLRA